MFKFVANLTRDCHKLRARRVHRYRVNQVRCLNRKQSDDGQVLRLAQAVRKHSVFRLVDAIDAKRHQILHNSDDGRTADLWSPISSPKPKPIE